MRIHFGRPLGTLPLSLLVPAPMFEEGPFPSSYAWQVFTCFAGCFACQTFWAAAAVFGATRGVNDLAGCILSTAAPKAGCKDCGK